MVKVPQKLLNALLTLINTVLVMLHYPHHRVHDTLALEPAHHALQQFEGEDHDGAAYYLL